MVSFQFSWARVVAVIIVIYVFVVAIMSAVAFRNIRDNQGTEESKCTGSGTDNPFYTYNELNTRYWLNVVSAILLALVAITMWIGN